MFGRMKRNFVSKLDQFLFDFDDKKKMKSQSQQAEIKKADRVTKMRDDNQYETKAESVWDNF